MAKIKYLLIFIGLTVFVGCSPKTTGGSKSKTTAPTEDLSKYRPTFETEEAPEIETPEVVIDQKSPATTPVNDITYKLNNVLDSLEVKTGDRTVQGYTIQVYSGNNREAANEAKAMVYKLIPESRPETTYIQPNYKVKVGRYASRMEAQKLYAKLKNDFPGAMVIPEKITFGRL